MVKFIIPGRLPGYNQLKGRCWQAGYREKQKAMMAVQICAMEAKIRPFTQKVKVTVACYEPNAKRDPDNVMSGANKVILDALQGIKILQNDNRRCVEIHNPSVEVDRKNPRVEVEMEEV